MQAQVQVQLQPKRLHLVFLPQKTKVLFPSSYKRTATSLRVSAAAPASAATTGNMYELLSVRESAGLEEIKAAFKRQARKLHPDTCRSSEEERERLTQQFIRAREAYRVLSDPDLRQDYDFRLKNGFALNKRSTSSRRQGFGDWDSQLDGLKRRSSVRHSSSSSSSWGSRMRARAAARN